MSEAVVVAVPAHDEEATVALTVLSLRRSIEHARRVGLVGACRLEVVAHRCGDGTDRAARAATEGVPYARVSLDETSQTVGEVRDRAVRRGLAELGSAPCSTWVLSTDADTVVGATWVADVVTTARRDRSAAVVGLSDLDQWAGSAAGAWAYADLVAAKMRPDGSARHQHDHVYGANLGVRADAYLDVGGFPGVVVGEDQSLVDALVAGGHRLTRTTAIRVVTSGRLDGRATGGLADRLRRLSEDPDPTGQRRALVEGR